MGKAKSPKEITSAVIPQVSNFGILAEEPECREPRWGNLLYPAFLRENPGAYSQFSGKWTPSHYSLYHSTPCPLGFRCRRCDGAEEIGGAIRIGVESVRDCGKPAVDKQRRYMWFSCAVRFGVRGTCSEPNAVVALVAFFFRFCLHSHPSHFRCNCNKFLFN